MRDAIRGSTEYGRGQRQDVSLSSESSEPSMVARQVECMPISI